MSLILKRSCIALFLGLISPYRKTNAVRHQGDLFADTLVVLPVQRNFHRWRTGAWRKFWMVSASSASIYLGTHRFLGGLNFLITDSTTQDTCNGPPQFYGVLEIFWTCWTIFLVIPSSDQFWMFNTDDCICQKIANLYLYFIASTHFEGTMLTLSIHLRIIRQNKWNIKEVNLQHPPSNVMGKQK